MAEVKQSIELTNGPRKRKSGNKKGKKMAIKRQRRMISQATERNVKVDKNMKRLFQKRARDYHSDDEEEEENEEEEEEEEQERVPSKDDDFEEENRRGSEEEEEEEGYEDGVQSGVTDFTEGIKAFKWAFKKIVDKKSKGDDDDVLGPVLSANKKLIAEKLAEEDEDKKVKGEAKKEKHLIAEKGHVKLENSLDAHEKFLLGVATKGVVKLFNAVNKAQNVHKGLNPSRSKDEKVIRKRRKEAFFSELGRTPSAGAVATVGKSSGEAPAWAPLRDNYMLTNPKLKDWDKMQDTNTVDEFGKQSDSDSSSDDE